jgi:hypothetical protein
VESDLVVALLGRELDFGRDDEVLRDCVEGPDVFEVDCGFGGCLVGGWIVGLAADADNDGTIWRNLCEEGVRVGIFLCVGTYLDGFAGGCGKVRECELLVDCSPLAQEADAFIAIVAIERDIGIAI